MSLIAVAGSLVVDLVATVPHLPRPGEAVHATSVTRSLGGKGFNQALAARRLGGRVRLAGAVGDDEAGRDFLAALDAEDVDRGHVVTARDLPTGFAVPMVDPDGFNAIVVALGANAQVPDPGAAFLEGADALLLQGDLEPTSTLRLAERAHDLGIPLVLNLAPADHRLLPAIRHASVVVVNEVEASDLGGGERLRAQAAELVVTLGERGADWNGIIYPPPRVEVVDTTGAGDALCGALALRLAEGAAFEEALRFAVAAGSAACRSTGAFGAMPERDAVEALLGARLVR